ncbi:MarR family winged helix-turn-helix transcriptional regulator [Bartonella sp. DGB2]|uniref:MarR family winged helix-turn-helix transcriptional regulator n=1 Tax=Bartonella sp. DGB2 TaxID=3388426 RepID=UPI00398F9996
MTDNRSVRALQSTEAALDEMPLDISGTKVSLSSIDMSNMLIHCIQNLARLIRTSLAHHLQEHGLYAGQDRIILSLADKDGQMPTLLARRLGVQPPTVTKTINRLQEQGFVTRCDGHRDQRQSHIFLTESGQKTAQFIQDIILQMEKDALYGLDDDEQSFLFSILAKMQANFSAKPMMKDVCKNHIEVSYPS